MDAMAPLLLSSTDETRAFGRHLGGLVQAGDWIALTGELGAGKTTLAAGVIDGVHPGMRARSPTYTLVDVHGAAPAVVHADLFRIGSADEVAALDLEHVAAGDSVTIVEWADRARGHVPTERLDLELRYSGERARELRIHPRGARWERLAAEGAFDRGRWIHAFAPRR